MEKCILKLYIAGNATASVNALKTLRRCEENLGNVLELHVIDVLQDPEIAERDRIIATPTLVKQSPAPMRRLIGDFSSSKVLAEELGLPALADIGGTPREKQ